MKEIELRYESAKTKYAAVGVDVEKALAKLSEACISIQCWQGDDVQGFISRSSLSGGIACTGNYPGRARNIEELRADLSAALSLIPGHHKVNLHAIYADTKEPVGLDKLEPRHFASWVSWAKKQGVGLDFNPTLFSHPLADSGFTLASPDEKIRNFWIAHCQRCREIGEYFGRELHNPCVTNIWIPDGFKDTPYDRLAPRQRLNDSLDAIFAQPIDPRYNLDAIEPKLFGIGAESYTVGSSEFYLGYAVRNHKMMTLDSGHFHPTEVISDKISSVLLFTDELLLHVSRPVRWDSDHVAILDDEMNQIAQSLVRNDLIARTHIGLDYFDGSINRVAAWVIGSRSVLKALLKAYLEPNDYLKNLENDHDYTMRLALLEELKTYPFGDVFDYYCYRQGVPVGTEWIDQVRTYEKNVLEGRK